MFLHLSSTSNRLQEIATKFHKLAERAWDPYRPELHYMRGRGPKWHAKHHRSLPVNTADIVAPLHSVSPIAEALGQS